MRARSARRRDRYKGEAGEIVTRARSACGRDRKAGAIGTWAGLARRRDRFAGAIGTRRGRHAGARVGTRARSACGRGSAGGGGRDRGRERHAGAVGTRAGWHVGNVGTQASSERRRGRHAKRLARGMWARSARRREEYAGERGRHANKGGT